MKNYKNIHGKTVKAPDLQQPEHFHTLAEALEAGEPPLVDKITGERDSRYFYADDGENHKALKVERVFCTASGGFVVLARPRTDEEEAEREQRHKAMRAEIKKAEETRIQATMTLPGYILIAWAYIDMRFRNETMAAYYLPEKGPRFVFVGYYKTAWKYDEKGHGYRTAKQDGEGLSRWSRREIADQIKQNRENYRLCAPLWLLTNIPDPRPRFLCPVIE
jgi:hypothetical protein